MFNFFIKALGLDKIKDYLRPENLSHVKNPYDKSKVAQSFILIEQVKQSDPGKVFHFLQQQTS